MFFTVQCINIIVFKAVFYINTFIVSIQYQKINNHPSTQKQRSFAIILLPAEGFCLADGVYGP